MPASARVFLRVSIRWNLGKISTAEEEETQTQTDELVTKQKWSKGEESARTPHLIERVALVLVKRVGSEHQL